VTLKLLKLDPELVPETLLYSIVDFSVANRYAKRTTQLFHNHVNALTLIFKE
jgi:hypothetical protein